MSVLIPVGARVARIIPDANPAVMTPQQRLDSMVDPDASQGETAPSNELASRRRRVREPHEESSAPLPAPTPPPIGHARLPLTLALSGERGGQAGLAAPALAAKTLAASVPVDSSVDDSPSRSMRSFVPSAGKISRGASLLLAKPDSSEPLQSPHAPLVTTGLSPGLGNEHGMLPFQSTVGPLPTRRPFGVSESTVGPAWLADGKHGPAVAASSTTPVVVIATTDASTSIVVNGTAGAATMATTANAGRMAASDVTDVSEANEGNGSPYDLPTAVMGSASPRLQPSEAPELRTLTDTPQAANRSTMGQTPPTSRAVADLAPPTLTVPFQWDGGDHAVTAHFHRGWHGPAILSPSTPEVRQQLLDTPGNPGWSMDRDAGDEHRRQRQKEQDDLE